MAGRKDVIEVTPKEDSALGTETCEWQAEMPQHYCARPDGSLVSAENGKVVRKEDAELVVTCANEELAKVRAERDAASALWDELNTHYTTMLLKLGAANLRESRLEAQRDAALARVRELTEWRSMETAPKGEWIRVAYVTWACADVDACDMYIPKKGQAVAAGGEPVHPDTQLLGWLPRPELPALPKEGT